MNCVVCITYRPCSVSPSGCQAASNEELLIQHKRLGLGLERKRSHGRSHQAKERVDSRRRKRSLYAQPGSFAPANPYVPEARGYDLLGRMGGHPPPGPFFELLGTSWSPSHGPYHERQLLPPLHRAQESVHLRLEWKNLVSPREQVIHVLRRIALTLHPRATKWLNPDTGRLVPYQDPVMAFTYPLGDCMYLCKDRIKRLSGPKSIHLKKSGYGIIHLAWASSSGHPPPPPPMTTRRTALHPSPPPSASPSSSTHDNSRSKRTLLSIGVHRFVCWAFHGMPPVPEGRAFQSEEDWVMFMREVQCMHTCNHPTCTNPRHIKFGSRAENRWPV